MSIRPLAGEAGVALYPQALSGGCERSPKAHNGHVPAGTFGGAVEEVHKTIVEERGPSVLGCMPFRVGLPEENEISSAIHRRQR
ncbi:hypothetical protein Y032_0030g2099 [Ancylostoma ceylanicum]|uniref:Uncharacterized protein n=1 Tax=Ancylostoma ceylanicum TaxID=53326 RepID=A0A016URH2_9BILA|nr:hypothetical protein Y032_0030g2099 [Ancylostoma ceylanicum]